MVNFWQNRSDAVAYILHYRPVITIGRMFLSEVAIPPFGQKPTRHHTKMTSAQSLTHWPLDNRIWPFFRQQINIARYIIHQWPLMAIDKQVYIHPPGIQSTEQTKQRHLGTPQLHIVHQYDYPWLHLSF